MKRTNRQDLSSRSEAPRSAIRAIALTGAFVGLGLPTLALAQMHGHAYGQPSDLAGPHVGTAQSPVRVSPALGSAAGGPTRYSFDLGFTRATVQCCTGMKCDVLQGNMVVYGEAASTVGAEGLSFGRGLVERLDLYGFEPTQGALVGQPAQFHGAAVEGSYTRAGMDLRLRLQVPDWTWITPTGNRKTCPSATVMIEGSMVTAPCNASECANGSAQRFGFGPSTLMISPAAP